MLNIKYYVLTFVLGLIGALLFEVFNFPIPWLLGPVAITFLVQFFTTVKMQWSSKFRDAGLILVGLSLGSFFTPTIFSILPKFIWMIFILNVVLIGCSILLAWVTAKWCKIDFSTALVSSIPGGLSQLVIFAEEKEAINLSIVTYFHVVRVLLVVSIVPLLMSSESGKLKVVSEDPFLGVATIGLIICGYLGMRLAKFIKVPVPALLGPVILVLLLNLFQINHAVIQIELLHVAQIFVGCHIGLSLKRKDVQLSKRLLIMGGVSAILLIGITMITGYLLSKMSNLTFETAFLSLAPGGLDQMSLIAMNLGGDVVLVTLFQLFRILAIYFIVLPLLNLTIK
ncbi:MAG: AbrB family transcriptional regulator [Solibacillus sp.]